MFSLGSRDMPLQQLIELASSRVSELRVIRCAEVQRLDQTCLGQKGPGPESSSSARSSESELRGDT